MSEAQALIDDIAAEYPELSREDDQDGATTLHEDIHQASLQLDQHDELAGDDGADDDGMQRHQHPGDDQHVDNLHGGEHGQFEDMAGLTDEALRQFANAAAMHYEANNNGQEGGHERDNQDKGIDHDADGQDHHQQSTNEYVDPSLSQVVSGSIPPPPRPTYQTTHSPSIRLDPSDLNTLHGSAPGDTNNNTHKRKRGDSFIATEQPLQAQADPNAKKHRIESVDTPTGLSDDNISSRAGLPDLPPPMHPGSRAPLHVQSLHPAVAPAPTPSSGRGRKAVGSRVRSQGAEDMMNMADGGVAGEGSDSGRKEGKDER